MIPITLSGSTIAADAMQGAIVGMFNTDGLRFATHGNGYSPARRPRRRAIYALAIPFSIVWKFDESDHS